MKLNDVIKDDRQINEDQLINRIKSFNWNYEFDEDFSKILTGNSELTIIENQLYSLWKSKPGVALRIWKEHCPYAPENVNNLPCFILRRQFLEEMANK